MTVIDVGANVGVYAFSAAQRVGVTGRVLAVEPFSGCVNCLKETRRVNQLDWVTVCRGAASDRNGTAHLALHSASEMNQVMTESDASATATEAIPCFTLDTLVEREGLQRVDLLKIDAEGHELQVLQGSDRLLKAYSPIVLYENIAGSQGSNLPVAEFLTGIGYQLFRYQP
ncbi:MAG: FkbM family methyltransferase, partial [Leptolyngbyaceae cyanobacterium CAN_BIN12]|nr:FkbM family methyltransferase [Leptolyngbyaceae cyanobacterium CAN_BIN12]